METQLVLVLTPETHSAGIGCIEETRLIIVLTLETRSAGIGCVKETHLILVLTSETGSAGIGCIEETPTSSSSNIRNPQCWCWLCWGRETQLVLVLTAETRGTGCNKQRQVQANTIRSNNHVFLEHLCIRCLLPLYFLQKYTLSSNKFQDSTRIRRTIRYSSLTKKKPLSTRNKTNPERLDGNVTFILL